MLLATLLAAAATSPHAISVSASTGWVMSVGSEPQGDYLEGGAIAGTRLQYDHTFHRGLFVGGVAGYERVWNKGKSITDDAFNAALVGGTIGSRWGKNVRGGLRGAAGFAYGFGEWCPTCGSGQPHTRSPGWFVDVEGEISASVGKVELFLDIPIVLSRTFYSGDPGLRREKWWYAVPIFPVTATVGIRSFF
ncbi:MAG: hypothetical protein HYV09_36260 [Deltaproteobacteria bacterium]|nr:hypothetical protein [Deltaproteobacteria bacterium]